MKAKTEQYFATWNVSCEHCGNVHHKHPETCPNYFAVDPERCKAGHSWFLRGSDPFRELRYEYECDYCSVPAIFVKEELKNRTHPFCEAGKHIWSSPCACDTCCFGKYLFCWCGAKKE